MKTVLVVDDEWIIAAVIEEILVEAGYRVVTAPNGQVALERIGIEMPDVIILDYMMPIMNGAATLAALADIPSYRDIPVLFITSVPEALIAKDASGYAAYLQKPFLDDALLREVARLLARDRSQSDAS
jgi:CheY-like chemotaxis protein